MKSQFSLLLAFLAVSGNAQTPTPSPDFDCPDENDAIFPDPNDCKMYFVCTNGLAWHESCPDGLLFHSLTLECDWPENAVCAGQTPPPTTARPATNATLAPTEGTQGPTEMPTEGPTGETQGPTENPTEAPTTQGPPATTPSDDFQCPDQIYHTYPHPTDCTRYFLCDNGVSYPYQCPDGLYFDPTLQVCNWPEFVDCPNGSRLTF